MHQLISSNSLIKWKQKSGSRWGQVTPAMAGSLAGDRQGVKDHCVTSDGGDMVAGREGGSFDREMSLG